ncbi:hypothetical protein ACH4U5_31610 [Streptomyces sp. NPDC020858]|uniref:hypothetical protein n=1 Tax=Streptomyces sp. NPDC020858 TaxID=3365097 RepID=UPI0037B50987
MTTMAGSVMEPRRRPPTWLRRVLIGAGVTAGLLGVAYAALLLLGVKMWDDLVQREQSCCWAVGATPEWMSGVMGLPVPPAATDRRAAFKSGSAYDTGLLVFTVTDAEAQRYLEALNKSGAVAVDNIHPQEPHPASNRFARLGLPEPETVGENMRLSGLCPGDVTTPEGKDVHYCTKVFAHAFQPGSTRLFLRATIEGAVTPAPTMGPPEDSGKGGDSGR